MHVSKLHNYQQQQQFWFLQAGATTTTTPETTTTITTKCPILPSTLISGIHESLPPFILLQNLVFYQIHYSSVLRLTAFLGFIYDSLDFLRLLGFLDSLIYVWICGFSERFLRIFFRIFGKVYEEWFLEWYTPHLECRKCFCMPPSFSKILYLQFYTPSPGLFRYELSIRT